MTVRDWPEVTTQPGAQLDRLLGEMGADVVRTAEGLQVTGGGRIRRLETDLGEVGELTPVLAALCALADGPSRLTGIGHLRGHETDRLQALDEVLSAVGARVEQLPDGLVIEPGPRRAARLDSYADHRMVMAAAVLGLAIDGVEVTGPDAVAKTLPDFVERWAGLLGEPAGSRLLSGRRHDSRSDEDDVRVRPSRRGSRPRTRTRPAHADAVPGLVVAVDRGRMTVRVEGPDGGHVDVTAMRARELGKHGVVVGDQVRLVGDTSGRTDSLARIVSIEERTTSLRRTADDTDPTERIVVANADQLVIVTSVDRPRARLGLPRPLPRGRVRRRARAAVLPDQDRPGQPAAAAGPLRRPRHRRRADVARGAAGPAARPARLADERVRRPVRCRQVDPGEPAGPRRVPGHRRRQQDRQGAAHVVLGGALRPARRAAR